MRTLLEAEAAGNERAKLAIDVFCYRLRKYIAAYVGALGGVDARGLRRRDRRERARDPRSARCRGSTPWASRSTRRGTTALRGAEAEISPPGARARVFVVPTNEELLIARDTFRIVSGLPPA